MMSLNLLPCLSNFNEQLMLITLNNFDFEINIDRFNNYFAVKKSNLNNIIFIYCKNITFNKYVVLPIRNWFELFISSINKIRSLQKENADFSKIKYDLELPIPYFTDQRVLNIISIIIGYIDKITLSKFVNVMFINQIVEVINSNKTIFDFNIDYLIDTIQNVSIIFTNEKNVFSEMLFLNNRETIKTYEDTKNVIQTFLKRSLISDDKNVTLLININNSISFKNNYKSFTSHNKKIIKNSKSFWLFRDVKNEKDENYEFDFDSINNFLMHNDIISIKNIIFLVSIGDSFFIKRLFFKDIIMYVKNEVEYENFILEKRSHGHHFSFKMNNNFCIYQEFLIFVEINSIISYYKDIKNTIKPYNNIIIYESINQNSCDILNFINKELLLLYLFYYVYTNYSFKNLNIKNFSNSFIDSLIFIDIYSMLEFLKPLLNEINIEKIHNYFFMFTKQLNVHIAVPSMPNFFGILNSNYIKLQSKRYNKRTICKITKHKPILTKINLLHSINIYSEFNFEISEYVYKTDINN